MHFTQERDSEVLIQWKLQNAVVGRQTSPDSFWLSTPQVGNGFPFSGANIF